MGWRRTRREFLALVVSGPLVQGCGAMRALDVADNRPPGAPAAFVAKEEDVKSALYFVKGDIKGVLVRTPKGLVGYRNKCTLKGAPCVLKEGALVCVLDGSAFDPTTGKVLRGPAREPLAPLKLDFKNGFVLLAAGQK
ncbi:MAG: Rieske 2Fe-2S domain-containing protein [Planctomycetes bacterium]|nr:Rieske 2Fe-2S domain-containing protein [Planctomycetota bacterium]